MPIKQVLLNAQKGKELDELIELYLHQIVDLRTGDHFKEKYYLLLEVNDEQEAFIRLQFSSDRFKVSSANMDKEVFDTLWNKVLVPDSFLMHTINERKLREACSPPSTE